MNHLLAELATAVLLDSPKPPGMVLDWEVEHKDYALPNYEPSLRIQRTKTLSAHVYTNRQAIINFFQRVEAIHWIDAHRFPTNEVVIKAFVEYFCKRPQLGTLFFLHSTPRQLSDTRRKWIKKEHNIFLENLKKYGTSDCFYTKTYFGNEMPSMENHFKCLEVFDTQRTGN